ncbi:transcription initiation factor IIE subunit beta (tfa2) [Vairimorpha necatrix]|uniref:Transcription initiation factor IIE subunit beta (Tfa2) n=1 Tax=Vairimorpha necatrix TaxID=6039 RepID=A0AAX4JCQ1_9MICR
MQENDRHTNSYLHDILTFLKSTSGSVTFTDLYNKLKIDIHSNLRLLNALQSNEKIRIQNNLIEYLYTYNIKNKEDLVEIFKNKKEGIELVKLKDNPVDISGFLEDFLILKDNDGSEVVFYNELHIDKLDEELINLWRAVKIPGYQDMLSELNCAGLKSDKNEVVKRKIINKKAKSKKYRRNIKITNTHVKGLDLSGMDDHP